MISGYIRKKDVLISSGIDGSVTYIGSGISVLKPQLLEGKIRSEGEFIKQKAIRTQGLKNIYEEKDETEFYSFFDALCVLSKYENLDKLVNDSCEFFVNYLNMKPEEIMFRVSSGDKDLIKALEKVKYNVKTQYDSREEIYYKHKYGLDEKGINGRNMNFAFLDKNKKEFKDVGNIIVLESEEKKYAAELALGVQPTVMRKFSIDSSIESSYIADIVDLKSSQMKKYAECLVVVANLNKENVKNIKDRRYPVYLYKKYLRALKYYQETLGISKAELINDLESYLELEYNPEFEYKEKSCLKHDADER